MARRSAAPAVDRTLKALADPTRRRVVELLRTQPRRAGDIAAGLGMSAPATSRHLRVLHRSGLIEDVSVEDDARVRVFRLRPEPLAELSAWLSEVEQFWRVQLDAFTTHVERTGARSAQSPRRKR
jgi:DNA-binding transcriptional ArsR family regulator